MELCSNIMLFVYTEVEKLNSIPKLHQILLLVKCVLNVLVYANTLILFY